VPLEAEPERGIIAVSRPMAGVDDDVDRRQLLLMQPKGLARQSFDPIATHRIADGARADGQAEARVTEGVRTREDGERAINGPSSFSINRIEVRLAVQALFERQSLRRSGQRGPVGFGRRGGQTANRARPFARRRFSTIRPALVAIRARKPCVRLRCRLLGWYVRFIVSPAEFRS
jgi:hypothetical protein